MSSASQGSSYADRLNIKAKNRFPSQQPKFSQFITTLTLIINSLLKFLLSVVLQAINLNNGT